MTNYLQFRGSMSLEKMSPVMLFAQKSGNTALSTYFTRWVSSSMMKFSVFRTTSNLQIGNSIVSFYSIFVMNNLMWFKKPIEVFLHYKSVFSNISHTIYMRMIWLTNHYISRICYSLSAFPVVTGRTFGKVFNVTDSALLGLIPPTKVGLRIKSYRFFADDTIFNYHNPILI